MISADVVPKISIYIGFFMKIYDSIIERIVHICIHNVSYFRFHNDTFIDESLYGLKYLKKSPGKSY